MQVDNVTYSPGDVFNVYLNAEQFHQDIGKATDREKLRGANPFSSWMMQLAVMHLSRCVRNLDAVLAYVLDEEPPAPIDELPPERPPYQF